MVIDVTLLVQLITIVGAIVAVALAYAKAWIVRPFNIILQGLTNKLDQSINSLVLTISKLTDSVDGIREMQKDLLVRQTRSDEKIEALTHRVHQIEREHEKHE